MTINYTSLLGLAEPVTGTQDGTWGDDVNKGITDYLDIAIAGTQTISGSLTAVTLSLTNGSSAGSNIAQAGSGSTGSAQFAVINCTGNPASLLTVTVPASSRQYIVLNATSTSQSVKIVGAGPTTGVTIASGEKAHIAWDGSDFVKIASSTAVTSVAVASANGLAGSSSGGSTPTLTLSTSVTGLLKGNGTAISAAVSGTDYAPATSGTSVLKGDGSGGFSAATAGTDYVAPGTATTFTATQTFSGSSSVKAMKTSNIAEVDTISATAATGTINYDITTQSVLYYSSNASANWTVNFRGSSGTSLDTLMATGECISATFLVTQGATAYYNSAVTIDGSAVTPKWQGGTAPTSGNASSVDCYTYVIQKTGSATFAVLASQTKFA